MLLDPGFNLTLRPMRYPQFYEMYRDAIRNTWTVEEVDFSDDVVDLQRKLSAGRAAPDPPPGGVLRHRRLDRVEQPGAQPLQAHQRARGAHVPVAPALRRGAARAVLPDAARHLRPDQDERAAAFAAVENIPSIRAEGRVLHEVDRLDPRPGRAARPARTASSSSSTSSASRLHRGLFFFGAFAYVYFLRSKGCCTVWPRAPTGCSATRAPHELRVRGHRAGRERRAGPLRRRPRRPSPR
jgi:ribonucleoside-diphosphate reductase beta chain